MTSPQTAIYLTKRLQKNRCKVKQLFVIGPYVHIDTRRKFHSPIAAVMRRAGYKLTYSKGGRHHDGLWGYRMVFLNTRPT